MKPIAIALTFAIVLPALPARAAPRSDSEESYRDLEAASDVDLSRTWASYDKAKRPGSFGKYAERRFRIRRDVGRGLAITGGAFVLTSLFFMCFSLAGGDFARGNAILAASSVGLGGGLIISGSVVAGVYGRRLDRIQDASVDLELGAADLAYRPGSRPLARSGLGLRFAF